VKAFRKHSQHGKIAASFIEAVHQTSQIFLKTVLFMNNSLSKPFYVKKYKSNKTLAAFQLKEETRTINCRR